MTYVIIMQHWKLVYCMQIFLLFFLILTNKNDGKILTWFVIKTLFWKEILHLFLSLYAVPSLSLVPYYPLFFHFLTSVSPTDAFLSDNSGSMQRALPVDISWLKATSACQYRLLVFAHILPASNTADYWRPLIAVLSCCPHSCYLADSFIVYMQMEVGYWTTKTITPNGKQTIREVCRKKVRSIELINTCKGTHYRHCDLYFLLVTSSEIFIWKIDKMSNIP